MHEVEQDGVRHAGRRIRQRVFGFVAHIDRETTFLQLLPIELLKKTVAVNEKDALVRHGLGLRDLGSAPL